MDGLSTEPLPLGIEPALPSSNRLVPTRRLVLILRVGIAVASLAQLGLMLTQAWVQWHRFGLTTDFAQYSQAQWLIGHGQLNPHDTVSGVSFARFQATYIMWPLGLVWTITRTAFSLLVVQAAAIAACTWIGGIWILEVVQTRLPGRILAQVGVVGGLVAALALNPFAFEASFFDFHPEPICALFLLLAARALWRRSRVSPFVWAALALTTGGVGTLLTIGLGLGVAMLVPGRRRQGLAIFVGAMVWLTVILVVGLALSTPLDSSYGYLAPGVHNATGISGMLALGFGIVQHPSTALHTLWHRRHPIYQIFQAGGMIGVFTGWGAGVIVIDLLANGLFASYTLIAFGSGAFQNFPAVVLLTMGSALAVVWLLHQGRRTRVLGVVIGLAVLANSLALAVNNDNLDLPRSWLKVSPSAQVALAQAQSKIPSSWAVIASQGVVGRFGTRTTVFPYSVACEVYPLPQQNTAVILAPEQGVELVPAVSALSAVAQLKRAHSPLLIHSGGIWVFRVHRTPNRQTLQLGTGCSTGTP